MSTSETPRTVTRRRRRKPTSTEKENDPMSENRQVPSRPLKSQSRGGDNDDDFSSFLEEDAQSQDHTEALRQFQKAQIATISSSLWKEHPNLSDCVIRASLVDNDTVGAVYLEEHSTALLSMCRKLIKEATETNDNRKKVDHLFVAVHGLRAIGPTLSLDTARQEAAIRLLYHLITTATEIEKEWRAPMICLAGYQALGRLLSQYSCVQENGDSVTFELVQERLFSIPSLSLSSRRESRRESPKSTMTLHQVSTIALKSTFAVAGILNKLWWANANQQPMDGSCDHFGVFVSRMYQQVSDQRRLSQSVVVQLHQMVVIPWISFLANASDKDCVKDVSSHCKVAHRMFWDMATQLKQASKLFATDDLQMHSLELRKHAILVLLPNNCPPKVSKWLGDQLLETACACAWKAALNYAQHTGISSFPVPATNPLARFHAQVGGQLHSVLKTSSTLPLCYAEYCAYLSLHTGTSPGIHSCGLGGDCYMVDLLPAPPTGEFNDDVCSRATLALFLLALFVRQRLDESMEDFDFATCSKHEFDLVAYSRTIIASFQSQFIDNYAYVPKAIRQRCFKLWSLLPLHRTLFQKLKEKSWAGRTDEITVAATILSKCLGPFSYNLLRHGDYDESKHGQFWDMTIECYIRSASTFDRLGAETQESDPESSSGYIHMSNEVIDELEQMLLLYDKETRPPPSSCIEKCAKALALIARQRSDRSQQRQSVMPLLHSTQLFMQLSYTHSIDGEEPNYQISARWAHLASVLQSLEMIDEACIASVAALVTDSSGPPNNCDSYAFPLNLLSHFASQSSQALACSTPPIPVSDQRKSMTRRLVTLFSERKTVEVASAPSERSTVLSVRSALRLMIENIDEKSLISTVVEQKYGIRFQLGELLRIMFLEGTRREETADRLVEKVAVLVEVLVCLGGTIQRLSLEESEDAINLTRLSEDYEAVLSVIINLIRRITDSFQQTSAQPVLLASLYIVASSALLPYRSFYHDALAEENGANLPVPSFTLAKRLAEKAKRCVETPSESDPDLEVLLVSTRASIWYYCHHLSRLRGHPQERFVDKIQQLCVLFYDAVEPFRLHSESASPLHAFSSSCLLWSLSNFRGLLEWDGDILRAALVAQWTCCLIPDHERFASFWNHAATTNACLSADILPNPATSIESKSTLGTLVGLLETPQVMDTLNHLFEVEFLISQFRLGLQLENGSQVDTDDQSRTLLVLQRKIEEIENSSALEVSVFAEWVLASIELTHTEISEINGDLCGALSHNKLCMKRCQTLSSILRRAHGLLHTYPFWARVAFSTLYCQVNEREKYCLRRTVLLYSRLGDYRKAEAYAVSAMLSTGVHDGPASKSRSKFSELLLSEASIKSSNEKLFFRLRMEVQAMATSLDHVASELSNKSVDNIVVSQNSVGSSQRSLSVQMDDSITLLSFGDMLYGDSVTGFQQEFAEYYKQALLKHEEFVEACSIQQKTPLCMEAEEMIPLVSHMKLRRVRCLLEGTGALSFDGQKQARELCEEVVRCCSTVGATKAWAYFYLGCLDLDNSRRTGALSNLWAGHSNHFEHELFRDQRVMTACSMETEDNIQGARKHFLAAASLLGSATDVFRRKVIRNLALATGPESGQPVSGMSASSLILTSVGRLTRHHALRSMECHIPAGGEGRNPSELENAFLSFDSGFNNVVERDHKIKDFYARLEKMLPADWTFVAPAICPSGEILMTSIFIADSGSLQSRTICIFPGENKGGAYDEILQPLDEIIQSSQNYLKGVDSSNASEHFAKDSAKREWWNERKKQDSDLKELIERVEAEYFGFSLARKLFHGNEVLTEDCSYGDDDSSDLSCGNLASKFEAACDLSDRLCDHDDIRLAIDDREDFDSEDERLALQKLTVPVLKSRLHDLEVSESEMRKLRKAELIDLLVRTEQNRRKNTVKYEKPDPRNYLSESSKRCTFLILDENLHRFPFEGMTFLAQKAVCRVPSLPFVFASLHEQQLAKKEGPILVDPATTTYVLDPENNLQGTRARVLPVLERLGSQTNWNWSGVVGEIPPPSLFEEGLSKDDGLMLYFGHGGGQVCFSRRQIETMSGGQGGTFRSCKASVILMGCSSGRLVSVNRKHTESTKEFPLYYDPEGISISYLCAGAPCVVGNLWDVTDHDIDRYSMALLDGFLGEYEEGCQPSLAECVSRARSACKMPYIVGCAPVCYGVPVYRLST